MPGLRTVHIKRFKNINDAPFTLSEVNVIVGSNNSGKSSILQAIHFTVGAIQSLSLENRLKGRGKKTYTVDPSKLIYVPSEDVHTLGVGGRLWEQKEKSVQVELGFHTGANLSVSVLKGRNRNIQIVVSDISIASQIASLEQPITIFTPGLAGIAKAEQYVSDGVLLRTIARGDSNLVLRNTLLRLWDQRTLNSKWHDFITDLNEIFPNLNIVVSFSRETDETIKVSVISNDMKIPLELGGQGVLQTVQILSYIHCFTPRVIVLDEPDSHLHPNNQRLLCSLLRMIAQNRDVQIILSTHSRHVLDSLHGTANLLWARNGGVDTATDGSELAILLDLGALDIKEMIPAGLKVCVVLTEDEKANSLNAVLESSGFDMSQSTILPYYGCTSLHNLRPLIDMIKELNRNAMLIVHKDRDYHSDEETNQWQQTVRSMGAEAFVTRGVDIESHLLNHEYIAALNPSLTLMQAADLINRAMVGTRDDSIRNYVNGRIDIERKAGTYGKLDVGALATKVPQLYDRDPKRYCHSKTVVSKVRQLFQTEHALNLQLYKKSDYISDPTLASIVQRVFSK